MFSGIAWRVVRFGEPAEALELHEMTWGVPLPGHVLIRVSAAGAGYPDRAMTVGRYPLIGGPPFGLGEEAAGEVVAVPEDSKFSVGDHITGITAFQEGYGGYATYAYVLEACAIRVPARMSAYQAGGFPIGFRTAHAGLVERARVEAGHSLLILGASGSSGSAALQLAKVLKMNVIAVAGGAAKANFCAQLGADHVIDHRTEDLTARVLEITDGRGVDVIYDLVGGEFAATASASLARNGSLILVGQAGGTGPSLDPTRLTMNNHSVVGVLAIPQEDPRLEAIVWDTLEKLATEGAINTAVGSVYGIEEVPLMVVELASAAPGKTVVRVS